MLRTLDVSIHADGDHISTHPVDDQFCVDSRVLCDLLMQLTRRARRVNVHLRLDHVSLTYRENAVRNIQWEAVAKEKCRSWREFNVTLEPIHPEEMSCAWTEPLVFEMIRSWTGWSYGVSSTGESSTHTDNVSNTLCRTCKQPSYLTLR